MFASVSLNQTVQPWDTKQDKFRRALTVNTDSVYSLAFNLDGTTLASRVLGRTMLL